MTTTTAAHKTRPPRTRIGARNWVTILIVGLAGQMAWSVENTWLNTFVFDTITPNPAAIAWMSAVSALVGTIATLVMGNASDRAGRRRPFILWGYAAWGVSILIFPSTTYIQITTVAVIAVITLDAVMTFIGSTANDAAFNAWTTDISDPTNRATLTSVLSAIPVFAAVVANILSGVIIDSLGYTAFFVILGVVVSGSGVIGALLLKESPTLSPRPEDGRRFLADLVSVFGRASVKANAELFLVFLAIMVTMTGLLVSTPYQIIYLNNYVGLSKAESGVIGVGALVAALLFLPLGRLADRVGLFRFALAMPFVSIAGSIMFATATSIPPLIAASAVHMLGVMGTLFLLSAWVKNLMPQDRRGLFEGVRMIFQILIPMVLGPTIGAILISTLGQPTVTNGAAGAIPTPIIFIIAGAVGTFAIIPMIAARRHERRTAGAAQ